MWKIKKIPAYPFKFLEQVTVTMFFMTQCVKYFYVLSYLAILVK